MPAVDDNQQFSSCFFYSHQANYSIFFYFEIFYLFSGWFRAILPKSALRVEEEAWNSYPYTKTRYRCPFVEKFLLEIETKYINDGGDQENVFNMSQAEMKQRQIGLYSGDSLKRGG